MINPNKSVIQKMKIKLLVKYDASLLLFNLYSWITSESLIPKEKNDTDRGTIVENKT